MLTQKLDWVDDKVAVHMLTKTSNHHQYVVGVKSHFIGMYTKMVAHTM